MHPSSSKPAKIWREAPKLSGSRNSRAGVLEKLRPHTTTTPDSDPCLSGSKGGQRADPWALAVEESRTPMRWRRRSGFSTNLPAPKGGESSVPGADGPPLQPTLQRGHSLHCSPIPSRRGYSVPGGVFPQDGAELLTQKKRRDGLRVCGIDPFISLLPTTCGSPLPRSHGFQGAVGDPDSNWAPPSMAPSTNNSIFARPFAPFAPGKWRGPFANASHVSSGFGSRYPSVTSSGSSASYFDGFPQYNQAQRSAVHSSPTCGLGAASLADVQHGGENSERGLFSGVLWLVWYCWGKCLPRPPSLMHPGHGAETPPTRG
ncbi:hypothetical protein B0J18DRAFT_41335 [Chaetomium sp. MPI-SDFR-AT-0129]|nr:hypothetical protein B0J18DRAFT_41335 [Chaetomium sp. MPI-SDFR-AT-0129]